MEIAIIISIFIAISAIFVFTGAFKVFRLVNKKIDEQTKTLNFKYSQNDFNLGQTSSAVGVSGSVSIFISYAHGDEELKDDLKAHLSALKRSGKINTWDDRHILPGNDWEKDINVFLEKSDIILLLVSSDFLASDYCTSVELKKAIERHNKREALIIPVAIRACNWVGMPFEKIQGVPRDLKAVTSWVNRDEAFTDVVSGISTGIDFFLSNRR